MSTDARAEVAAAQRAAAVDRGRRAAELNRLLNHLEPHRELGTHGVREREIYRQLERTGRLGKEE